MAFHLGKSVNFGRGKHDAVEPDSITEPADTGALGYLGEEDINPGACQSRPMAPNMGMVGANPHMLTPNRDQEYDRTPITFNRFGTRWGDIQLKNGLANKVASGRINGYRGEGWYDVTVPLIPGQTRLVGSNHPGYFAPKGGAPSQWQDAINQGPGSQPMYPGGPGYLAGPELYNPGSGG